MEKKKRASRNRTLTLTEEQTEMYFRRCVDFSRGDSLEDVTDKTIHGDCFEVLKQLPKKSVDLLIVDPPYNLSKNFNGNVFKAKDAPKYAAFTQEWLELCLPLLTEMASVYVCCDWKSSLIIGPIIEKYLNIQNRITWQREKGRGAKANWKNGMEDIWYATVSNKAYCFNLDNVMVRRRVIAPYKKDGKPKDWEDTKEGRFRNTCPSNFWDDCTVPYWSMPENTDHPTQKPEKLIAKLVLASSNPGDLILDPFLGSGTTSVVAKKLGRHYIGIEEVPEYCAWCEARLARADEDKSIQGYSDGVFWERNSLAFQKKAVHDCEKNSSNSDQSALF